MSRKATITYRFDGKDRMEQRPQERRQEPHVIPLYREEFQVVEQQDDATAVQRVHGHDPHDAVQHGERMRGRTERVVLNEYTRDFGTYRSPFDEDTERVERIIKESQRVNGETGYVEGGFGKDAPPAEPVTHLGGADAHASGHDEQYREPFASGYEGYRNERRGDDGSSYEWGEPQIGTRYAKSSGTPPWTRIVLSITGAVLTGVLFGFIVLSTFTDDPLPFGLFGSGKAQVTAAGGGAAAAGGAGTSIGGTGVQAGQTSVTMAGTASGTTSETASGTASGLSSSADSLVAVNLPGRSYVFLQNGIFSSEAAAQTAQDELKKKGYAAASVAEPGDKTTVYAGFALQKQDALQLSRKLQGDKLDVFVKAVTVPAAPKLKWTGQATAGELSTYFQQGDKLVQMIGSLTVLHLGETKPSAIEVETLAAIKTTHQSWIAASTQVKAGAPETVAPALQQMATALNTAVVSMDEYRKNVSSSYLWQSQSALMQYVLAERGLLTKLAAE